MMALMNIPVSRELEKKLNWLRASVLGANDGIVSIAGIVVGVAASGAKTPAVLVAGVAALVAGAVSMAGGEYTSVSAQKDTEIAHGRDPKHVTAHPWSAAWSSMAAFCAGGILPLIAITGPWVDFRVPATFVSVVAALAITGWWAAKVGKGSKRKSIARNVAVSVLTMTLAYLVGAVLGVTVFA
jgi:VIT1/CCC1 family predicted Fe2+/Mn2+ transporter